MRATFFILIFLAQTATAAPITYIVHREISEDPTVVFTIDGTLTTDGTLGLWEENHLTAFALLFTIYGPTGQVSDLVTEQNGLSTYYGGRVLQATEHELLFFPFTNSWFFLLSGGEQRSRWELSPGCLFLQEGYVCSERASMGGIGRVILHPADWYVFAHIPEPGTAGLVALGLLGLTRRRAR
jgi:PEP-CTERM putative exosortase interaction domain